jgi:sugar/nucleoside kinase (ribokinase family)
MKRCNGSISVMGVGSPVVDHVARVPESFLAFAGGAKGGMALVDAVTLEDLLGALPVLPVRTPGGSAANTALAMARLGVPSGFLGSVGADRWGDFYRRRFEAAGGRGDAIRRDGSLPTAQCLSLVTPDGERTMRTHLGAASSLHPSRIAPGDFRGYGHVHVEGYLLLHPDLLRGVLDAARAEGCGVSLDLASFEVVAASMSSLPRLLTEYVDIVFANEEEAGVFAGSDDAEACLAALNAHCPAAVVKRGAMGALLAHLGNTVSVPAQPAGDVVDTTGAGDLWAAGFLYGWLTGAPLAGCGAFGATLAAAVVGRQGAALPDAEWRRIRTAVCG